MRSRPGGSQFGIGNLFNEVGLAQSGLFCGRELLLALDVENQESGFMGISGKYTKTGGGSYYVGEHNVNNKLYNGLQGRGIKFYSDGDINIGYYNNGYGAPGNFITIYKNGEFHVGEYYLKDAILDTRGTRYNADGTTKKFRQ